MDKLERLFDAVDIRLAADDWDGLFRDISQVFEANVAALYVIQATGKNDAALDYHFLAATSWEVAREYVRQQTYQHQIESEFRLADMKPMLRGELAPDEVYRSLRFYQEFAKHHNIWWMIGSQFLLSHDCVASLVLTRGEAQPDFDAEDLQRVTLLGRYLRSFVLARLLQEAAFDLDAPVNVAKFVRTPAVHVTADYRIIAYNREFLDLIETADAIGGSRIALARPGNDIRRLPRSGGYWYAGLAPAHNAPCPSSEFLGQLAA